MSLRLKLAKAIGGKELAAVQARYEAAYWNTNRTYLPGFIQGAREDIDTMSRQEILRRVRYFEKNSCVMLKVLSLLDTNIIGAGITPAPCTEDAAWNKLALDWWNDWAEVADITGENSIYELQSIAHQGMQVDGDSLIHMTLGATNRPALEIIESHRIGTYGVDLQMLKEQGYRVSDGVQIDQFGRAMAYFVTGDFDKGRLYALPASQCVHLFRRKRAGQSRGLTPFHAAIQVLHDLDDLQKFEMRAAKDAASISKIIESAAGATTPDGMGVGASLTQLNTTDINGRTAYYRQALGGETILTQPGDKYTQYKSERPSAATSGFWDKLGAMIVQGGGVSEAALVDYKGNWGGATLRAAIQSDNRVYSLGTARQARKWQKVWDWAIPWAMTAGELPPNPKFGNVRWHPPKRTTVDVGNDSAAMIEELKGGLKTYQDIYGEIGEEWKDRIEQRAKEEAFINEMAEKYGVDRQFIASFAQERLAGQAPDAVGPVPGAPGAPASPAQTPQGKPKAAKGPKSK